MYVDESWFEKLLFVCKDVFFFFFLLFFFHFCFWHDASVFLAFHCFWKVHSLLCFPFFDIVFMFTQLLVSSESDWWEFLFYDTRGCFGVHPPEILRFALINCTNEYFAFCQEKKWNYFSRQQFCPFLILKVKSYFFLVCKWRSPCLYQSGTFQKTWDCRRRSL